jgi:hypothetical protein
MTVLLHPWLAVLHACDRCRNHCWCEDNHQQQRMRDTPLLAAVAAAVRLGATRTMGGRDALAVDNEKESESSGANDDELVAAIELGTDVLAPPTHQCHWISD